MHTRVESIFKIIKTEKYRRVRLEGGGALPWSCMWTECENFFRYRRRISPGNVGMVQSCTLSSFHDHLPRHKVFNTPDTPQSGLIVQSVEQW